jgi:hypothetical protein
MGNWYPHYEALLIVSTDPAIHDGLMRTAATAFQDVLRDLPADAKGDIDAPMFHLRKGAARNAKMSSTESQDYRGLLIKGGLVMGR